MQQLRRHYIEALPARLAALETAWDEHRSEISGGTEGLRRLAHNLKGSGATYGFPDISEAARSLEELLLAESPDREAQEKACQKLTEIIAATRKSNRSMGHRILIVEDDPDTSGAWLPALTAAGFDTQISSTLEQARAALDKDPFDAYVIDLLLPDGDGRNLIADLRKSTTALRRPIVVVSALGEQAVRTECLALGANAHLPKPVTPRDLVAVLSSHISVHVRETSSLERDPLTSLLTREGFSDRFNQTMALLRRCELPVSTAILDIDHLSEVNRHHGRDVGDFLVASLASWLSLNTRRADLLCRWGNEEFALMMPATEEDEAKMVVERLVAGVRKHPWQHASSEAINITISAGVCETRPTSSPEEAVARADWYLFEAKSNGRDQVAAPSESKRSKPGVILVADDDADVRKLLEKYLGDQGFLTLCRPDGESAFTAALSSHVDLAILDLSMPGMDGHELLQKLRRTSETKDLPILILTGCGEEAGVVQAFERGADDYMVKPFSMAELEARVQRLLRPRI